MLVPLNIDISDFTEASVKNRGIAIAGKWRVRKSLYNKGGGLPIYCSTCTEIFSSSQYPTATWSSCDLPLSYL